MYFFSGFDMLLYISIMPSQFLVFYNDLEINIAYV